MSFRNRLIATAVAIVAVGGLYFLGQNLWWGAKYLPAEFTEARAEGALVAEKIVFFAHQSLAGLEQIAQLDELKRYDKALKLAQSELERNEKARQEAILLSSHLEIMVTYLSEIKPSSARALATEAIGHEVNLVNHLINFHGLLSELFQLLEGKFDGRIKNSDSQVKALVDEINGEIKAINQLNLKFNSVMDRFDQIFPNV